MQFHQCDQKLWPKKGNPTIGQGVSPTIFQQPKIFFSPLVKFCHNFDEITHIFIFYPIRELPVIKTENRASVKIWIFPRKFERKELSKNRQSFEKLSPLWNKLIKMSEKQIRFFFGEISIIIIFKINRFLCFFKSSSSSWFHQRLKIFARLAALCYPASCFVVNCIFGRSIKMNKFWPMLSA